MSTIIRVTEDNPQTFGMQDLTRFTSHYEYLDLMLEPFWLQVHQKTPDQMWCAGIVGAHGDKCYCYRNFWEDHNIPFFRGALLFLLTYTKPFNKGLECSEVDQWVADNYQRFLPMILEAEKQVLEKFYKG